MKLEAMIAWWALSICGLPPALVAAQEEPLRSASTVDSAADAAERDADGGTAEPSRSTAEVAEPSGGSGVDSTACVITCDTLASPSYCNIDCPGTANYIIFGEVWTCPAGGGTYSRAGMGVCKFASDGEWSKGLFDDYSVTATDVTDWRVRADATSAYGQNDLVRLAAPDTLEVCRAPDACNEGVKITGVLESGDTYLFWGDGGDDALFLCSYTAADPFSTPGCGYNTPASGDCISNAGRADGRDDDDWLYGSLNSAYADYLWGGSGSDALCGFSGVDVLRGGSGDSDYLWGGPGADWLEGGTGDYDTLNGDDAGYSGNDYLFGDDADGANSGTHDWCDCGSDEDYCQDENCENGPGCSRTCP